MLPIISVALSLVLPAQSFPSVVPSASWQAAEAADLGFDAARLERKVEALSGNVAIVRRGYLLTTERGDIAFPVALYSVSKSLTALLFGALLQQREVHYDDQLEGSDYPSAPTASFRQFLSMTSDYGLKPHQPGKHYAYNNEAVHFYGRYMDEKFLGSVGPLGALQKRFWDILGRQDPVTFQGTWSGWGGGFKASARDIARIGLLVQRRGDWQGIRVVPSAFVDALFTDQIPCGATMSTSTGEATGTNNRWNQQQFSVELNDGYSFGFWLTRSPKLRPNEAVHAAGRGGNFIIVVPKYELVIAVTNDQPQGHPSAVDYLDAVLDALVR